MNDGPAIAVEGGLSSRDRQAAETFYQAFSGRPELLGDCVAEDREEIPLAPGQIPGREAMKPVIQGFAAAFPEVAVRTHEVVGAPGRAAVRAEITGTHAGEWFGIAPTGRHFVLPIHEVHHLEDGPLTRTWHLED